MNNRRAVKIAAVAFLCASYIGPGTEARAQTSEPDVVRPRPSANDTLRDSVSALRQRSRVQQTPNCLRAQPAPLCTMFMLSEIAFEAPLMTSRHSDAFGGATPDFGVRLSISDGLMRNVGRNAYGGVLTMAADESNVGYFGWGIEARYKRWVTNVVTLDAGVGYERRSAWDETNSRQIAGNGVTAMASLTPFRWAGFTLRYSGAHVGTRTGQSLAAGVRSQWVAEKLTHYIAGTFSWGFADPGVNASDP